MTADDGADDSADTHPAAALTECEVGDELRLTMDDGTTYRVGIVDTVDYEPADGYSKGSVWTSVELDTDEHTVPSDELPNESGDLNAFTKTRREGSGWDDLMLSVWDPKVDPDGHVQEDRWRPIGAVSALANADGGDA